MVYSSDSKHSLSLGERAQIQCNYFGNIHHFVKLPVTTQTQNMNIQTIREIERVHHISRFDSF